MTKLTSRDIFLKALRQYCSRNGIDLESSSHGWINLLRRDSAVHLAIGYDLGLNSSATYQIINDKGATHDVLSAQEVPVVPTQTFINPIHPGHAPAGGNWQAMLELFHRQGGQAVVKANSGSGGKEVFLARDVNELEDAIHRLFAVHRAICIQPFLNIPSEVRAILVGGKSVLAYEKFKPSVVGNGTDSLGDLMVDQLEPAQYESLVAGLAESGELPDSADIPAAGAMVELSWKHNLRQGGRPVFLHGDAQAADELRLAVAAAKAVGLEFGVVDIARTAEGAMVMEINSDVTMEAAVASHPLGIDIAHKVFGTALDRVFARSGR